MGSSAGGRVVARQERMGWPGIRSVAHSPRRPASLLQPPRPSVWAPCSYRDVGPLLKCGQSRLSETAERNSAFTPFLILV